MLTKDFKLIGFSCVFTPRSESLLQKLKCLSETDFERRLIIDDKKRMFAVVLGPEKDSHYFRFPVLTKEKYKEFKELLKKDLEVWLGIDEEAKRITVRLVERGTSERLKELRRREERKEALKYRYVG